MVDEIVLPETKPALEWILGRAVQKVSPKRTHSRLQSWWVVKLNEWAQGRGEIGVEWRFRIAPPGEVIRPLVPDVSFLSYDRFGDATEEELEAPLMAPNVAIEILSPREKRRYVKHKIEVYLASGAEAVIVVDPETRAVTVHDPAGAHVFTEPQTFAHPALPGFSFRVDEMFDVLRIHRPR
jgi:Uma2 family endonuclease